jgi:hypothetical protein
MRGVPRDVKPCQAFAPREILPICCRSDPINDLPRRRGGSFGFGLPSSCSGQPLMAGCTAYEGPGLLWLAGEDEKNQGQFPHPLPPSTFHLYAVM